MTQGRQAYNVTVHGKTKLNLTALPALQATYMKADKHDVVGTTTVLNGAVKGFWVEMPLDLGSGENKTPKFPGNSPQTIAVRTSTTPVGVT